MSEISAKGVSPTAPETKLPLDLATMHALADRVLANRVVDAYPNILEDRKTLRGMLVQLMREVNGHVDRVADPGYALTQVAEARFRMTQGPGDGLISASHRTRSLATMVKTLAEICEEFYPPAPSAVEGSTGQTP